MVKKLIASLLTLAALLGLSGCGKTKLEALPDYSVRMTGDWVRAESPELDDARLALLDQALAGYDAGDLSAVAYLGSQPNGGTEHVYLCRTGSFYVFVSVREDADGKAELLGLDHPGWPTRLSTEKYATGGWYQPGTPALDGALRDVFDKGTEGLVGVSYTPVALLSAQVVAMMNYCFLCEATTVVPGAETDWVLLHFFEDTSGNVELTSIVRRAGAEEPEAPVENGAELANPFVDYATLEEAEEAAGFTLKLPERVKGYPEQTVQLMSGKMLQVIYRNGHDSRVVVRKAAGEDDVSGDYNSYSDELTCIAGGHEVTLKGNEGTVSLAVWTRNGYSFAVCFDEPAELESAAAIIEQIG